MIPYSYVVSTLANNGVGLGIPVPTSADAALGRLHRSAASVRSTARLVGGHTSIQPDCPTPTCKNKVTSEGGAFVQDRWTMDRLTVSAGLRLDWFYSENPEFHLGPSLLTPNRNYDVPKFQTTRYKDWTPKVAAAYDLFGDGRTALKVNFGKYVLGQALVVGGLASAARLQRAAHVDRGLGGQQPQLHPGLRSDRIRRPRARRWPASQNQIDTCNAPVPA